MAAERQEERSDEKQAGLWVEKVVQLASAAGQADPPKVVFDKRKSLGLAAYHYPHDELALDPDFLAVERTDLYCHEGLILHELGHRAAPTLLRVRRYLCVLLLATLSLSRWADTSTWQERTLAPPRSACCWQLPRPRLSRCGSCRGLRSSPPMTTCAIREVLPGLPR